MRGLNLWQAAPLNAPVSAAKHGPPHSHFSHHVCFSILNVPRLRSKPVTDLRLVFRPAVLYRSSSELNWFQGNTERSDKNWNLTREPCRQIIALLLLCSASSAPNCKLHIVNQLRLLTLLNPVLAPLWRVSDWWRHFGDTSPRLRRPPPSPQGAARCCVGLLCVASSYPSTSYLVK